MILFVGTKFSPAPNCAKLDKIGIIKKKIYLGKDLNLDKDSYAGYSGILKTNGLIVSLSWHFLVW